MGVPAPHPPLPVFCGHFPFHHHHHHHHQTRFLLTFRVRGDNHILTMATCANPGCDQPGTNKCGACNTTPYCGPICQTAHWAYHKEECPGHLRKIGMAHLEKAEGFDQERNFPQSLRHADLAATKFKLLKDCPVEAIDLALGLKYNALSFMCRHREALECAKEWYCLYLTCHTHPPAIEASFCLIASCVDNKEFFDAVLYARTLWETITLSRDSHIPEGAREGYTARGANELASALFHLAKSGGIPEGEQQEVGREAIMLARRALEINTQLRGAESIEVAGDMALLSDVLGYFNGVDDDEVLRLCEQAKSIGARAHGSLSLNVAACESTLGSVYCKRAERAHDADDLDRCVVNLELALPRLREASRIYQAINIVDKADRITRQVADVEKLLRQIVAKRAARASRG